MVMVYVLCSVCSGVQLLTTYRNKWVLNTTTTPLFFLFAQLLIAVVLFVFANAVGFFKIPLKPDIKKCKGLLPMVLINVVGLRRVLVPFFGYFECAEMILVLSIAQIITASNM
jgi:hypothetical protein